MPCRGRCGMDIVLCASERCHSKPEGWVCKQRAVKRCIQRRSRPKGQLPNMECQQDPSPLRCLPVTLDTELGQRGKLTAADNVSTFVDVSSSTSSSIASLSPCKEEEGSQQRGGWGGEHLSCTPLLQLRRCNAVGWCGGGAVQPCVQHTPTTHPWLHAKRRGGTITTDISSHCGTEEVYSLLRSLHQNRPHQSLGLPLSIRPSPCWLHAPPPSQSQRWLHSGSLFSVKLLTFVIPSKGF
jgi:hypothetical protein